MLRKIVRYLFLVLFICTIFTFCKDKEDETVRDILLDGKWYGEYWNGARDEECFKSSYLVFTSDQVVDDYDGCYLDRTIWKWKLSSDEKELTFYVDYDKVEYTIMSISSTRLVLQGWSGQYIYKR
jgi:hypothetical protein